ncbi:MAG: TraB/GumN family protein [Saprospiraceae bacterium]
MHITRICVILTVALLLGACAGRKAAVYAPEQLLPSENALLWRISGKGMKQESYLYGTIHVIPKAEFRLSEQARAALERSRRVAFEIDMRDMTNLRAQFNMLGKASMRDGMTLSKLLSEEDYQLVKTRMSERGLPMIGPLERVKPLFLSMMLGSDDEVGGSRQAMTSVEMELYRMCRKKRLESAGLETIDYQLSLFDSIPYEAQARMLVEAVRGADANNADELSKMFEMYARQDINAMQKSISSDDEGLMKYERLLLTQRNQNWIPVMERMMREKTTFFAVGAGHLAGPQGVIALLRGRGYRVDAIQ